MVTSSYLIFSIIGFVTSGYFTSGSGLGTYFTTGSGLGTYFSTY
jgi:hypothetical protein